jgi:hypothetical protein
LLLKTNFALPRNIAAVLEEAKDGQGGYRFAGTRLPDQGDGLSFFKGEGYIKENLLAHCLVLLVVAVEPEVKAVYLKKHGILIAFL